MAEYTLNDLLEEYRFQREQGLGVEQTLQLLAKLRPDLGKEDRAALEQNIRQWELERRQAGGGSASVLRRIAPQKTASYEAPLTEEAASSQDFLLDDDITFATAEAADVAREVVAALGQAAAFVDGMSCNRCGKKNPIDAAYCYACGNPLLVNAGDTSRLSDIEVEDDATFGKLSRLIIHVRGYENQPINLELSDRPVTVGRSSAQHNHYPQIDLAAYGGQEAGVSRIHAVLLREQATLTLLDKGSVNGTFINGEKVHPHEVRVIRDGDEVRFGKVLTRFKFQRQLKRLS